MWKADETNIVTPAMIQAEAEADTRAQRARLLTESDWTQLPDASADQALWAVYRQALRDLDMANPVWPERPAS